MFCCILDEFDIIVQIVFNVEYFKNLISFIIEQTVENKDLMVKDLFSEKGF
jgi:hypothetical protein